MLLYAPLQLLVGFDYSQQHGRTTTHQASASQAAQLCLLFRTPHSCTGASPACSRAKVSKPTNHAQTSAQTLTTTVPARAGMVAGTKAVAAPSIAARTMTNFMVLSGEVLG
eukprot:TRINITY_DN297_c0_g2_i3.p3 TRINITY_DN297_c0_g2~~TRINITY_DN297_c0_g2_i3.p3  ORF type:complete len:111 (+),score=11.75 TRINITY_DN297_c0_g2_i3:861-1193(+)